MALIEYIEPVSAGGILVGVGAIIFMGVMSWILYQFFNKFIQHMDISLDRESKYEIIEGEMLNKIAQEKGIDLEKELKKKKMIKPIIFKSNKFRRRIEDKLFEEMFGKSKEEDKK